MKRILVILMVILSAIIGGIYSFYFFYTPEKISARSVFPGERDVVVEIHYQDGEYLWTSNENKLLKKFIGKEKVGRNFYFINPDGEGFVIIRSDPISFLSPKPDYASPNVIEFKVDKNTGKVEAKRAYTNVYPFPGKFW